MTGSQYTVIAYALGLTLLWGYALHLWFAARSCRRSGGPERPEGSGLPGEESR
jgi:hypothetical protein